MNPNPSPSSSRPGTRPRRAWLGGLALGLVALTLAAASYASTARSPALAATATVRIGTYDSRAIGLAYGRSASVRQELDALHTQHKEALAAGDAARVKELEKKGISRQIRMHLQVFSNAPVGDAIDTIRDQLPVVAQRMNVVAITAALDHRDPTVEAVDVTDELVRLFDPTAETLRLIADGRTKKPMPIEEIAQMPADR